MAPNTIELSHQGYIGNMALSDDIKARLDIVDVVFRHVPDLHRAGRNYTARCPFHQERTPSFVVFPERQSWHCFGACATGGDVFSFVMRADGVDFSGAMKELAQLAGVSLPERRAKERVGSPIFDLNERALRFFQESLEAERGALARTYLTQRGIGEEAITRFGLGYSPITGSELMDHLMAVGFDQELLSKAGLITSGENGPPRDMFRGRLMFPIRNPEGQIVGFGGRAMDGSMPKYLNTAQTPVFDKSHILYALDLAKPAVSSSGEVVVVEGYMDVIAAHEHGFENVVASMGTALTEHQVGLLQHYARSFVLALDPDTAGQEATLRSLEGSWHVFDRNVAVAGRNRQSDFYARSDQANRLRIVTLPEGEDPDALIRRDPTVWSELVRTATPLIEYVMDAIASRVDMSSSQGKAEVVERLFPLIAGMDNPFEQDRYLQRLADLLGVTRATLEASAGRFRTPTRRRSANQARGSASAAPFRQVEGDALEEHVLTLMAQDPELASRAGELRADHFKGSENRALLSAFTGTGTMDAVYALLDTQGIQLLERLSERVLPPADRLRRGADFEACKHRLEERHLRDLKAQEEAVLTQAAGSPSEDLPYLDSVHQQSTEINERLKELFSGKGS
jgi:DNA primase